MSKLVWDQIGEKLYETGTAKGVLFPMTGSTYEHGVAWNGLTGVSTSSDGGDIETIYADDTEYLALRNPEKMTGSISAYTYPDEFKPCDGSLEVEDGFELRQQTRKPFGFTWQTRIGNDTDGSDHGYKIHIVYMANAEPSDRDYETMDDDIEAMEFEWDFTAQKIDPDIPNAKPAAEYILDSTKVPEAKLTQIENSLYGTDGPDGAAGTEPTLLTPKQIYTILHTT